MTERLCECGCGRFLESRREGCRFFTDACRAKWGRERRNANSGKRTNPKRRPTPPRNPGNPSGSETGGGEIDPEPTEAPKAEPKEVEMVPLEKRHLVYDKGARDATIANYNAICWALTAASSVCGLCRRVGGRPPEKGGAGPLRTKMGKPGAFCEDCWPKASPKEG